jgi:hypothetical protein
MDWLSLAIDLENAIQPSTLERIPTRHEMADMRPPGALQEGHEINDNIRDSLSQFDSDKVCRTYDQIRMQDLFLSSCTRVTYGECFRLNHKRIMAYNNWTSLHFVAGICTPRRWGKSWALAMFIACLMYWIAEILICIYSPGLRASSKDDGLLGHVDRFIGMMGVRSGIDKDSADHFKFRLHGTWREVKAFPGGTVRYVVAPRYHNSPYGGFFDFECVKNLSASLRVAACPVE